MLTVFSPWFPHRSTHVRWCPHCAAVGAEDRVAMYAKLTHVDSGCRSDVNVEKCGKWECFMNRMCLERYVYSIYIYTYRIYGYMYTYIYIYADNIYIYLIYDTMGMKCNFMWYGVRIFKFRCPWWSMLYVRLHIVMSLSHLATLACAKKRAVWLGQILWGSLARNTIHK